MQNLLNTVKMTRPNSNTFDLSHDVKLSFNMGDLIPTMVMECVPGDRFRIGCESLIRFAPLVSPVMHRMDVTMHYFFVPTRLLWDKWEDYITNTKTAGVLPAFPFFTLGAGDAGYKSVMDYMGIPRGSEAGGTTPENINALPFYAYNLIYNEYYRDQNLITKHLDKAIDGDNTANLTDIGIWKRAWEHDYFTASLPFAQKGDAVDIPLGKVEYNDGGWDANDPPLMKHQGGGISHNVGLSQTDTTGTGDASIHPDGSDSQASQMAYDPKGTLDVEATTINSLRVAFRLQEWLEKLARGGSRLKEMIKAMFGVDTSDSRLQRPEYIVGTKSPVMISEILNTTGTDDLPQGNMSGHGVSVTSGNYGGYRCEEHGFIIGVMSVMPKTAYMQGIPRLFRKINNPQEHYFPDFANLGEQEVSLSEIYAYQEPTSVFGYLPRYTEYKVMPSRVAGDFRTSLDFWHMARKFATVPALNEAFVSADPTARIFAVEDPDVQKMYAHVLHKISASRLMPKYGTPTF